MIPRVRQIFLCVLPLICGGLSSCSLFQPDRDEGWGDPDWNFEDLSQGQAQQQAGHHQSNRRLIGSSQQLASRWPEAVALAERAKENRKGSWKFWQSTRKVSERRARPIDLSQYQRVNRSPGAFVHQRPPRSHDDLTPVETYILDQPDSTTTKEIESEVDPMVGYWENDHSDSLIQRATTDNDKEGDKKETVPAPEINTEQLASSAEKETNSGDRELVSSATKTQPIITRPPEMSAPKSKPDVLILGSDHDEDSAVRAFDNVSMSLDGPESTFDQRRPLLDRRSRWSMAEPSDTRRQFEEPGIGAAAGRAYGGENP